MVVVMAHDMSNQMSQPRLPQCADWHTVQTKLDNKCTSV